MSREATFLYNNLLLVALCLTILWGVWLFGEALSPALVLGGPALPPATNFTGTVAVTNRNRLTGTFTVAAYKRDGTADTNYTGTVHFYSSDPQAALPPDYTFTSTDKGVHTFSVTFKTKGTQSLTAKDLTSGITVTMSGITVS